VSVVTLLEDKTSPFYLWWYLQEGLNHWKGNGNSHWRQVICLVLHRVLLLEWCDELLTLLERERGAVLWDQALLTAEEKGERKETYCCKLADLSLHPHSTSTQHVHTSPPSLVPRWWRTWTTTYSSPVFVERLRTRLLPSINTHLSLPHTHTHTHTRHPTSICFNTIAYWAYIFYLFRT